MNFKLRLHDVTKVFNNGLIKKWILTTVSAVFEQGKTYALIGASGSGKSTLMHLIAGLDTPTTGSLFLNEKPLQNYQETERARTIVLVTQAPFLIKELTVLENVMLAGMIIGMPQQEIEEQANFYLAAVGLSETASWKVGALSGGQRQRVCIARALLVKPAFLCADEPTGALDEKTGESIIALLCSYQKKEGMGLIISSHNPAVVAQMEMVFALKDGILMPHQD